ncbi:MAG: NADH-quinone oxidoreductase subunit D [Planctomycetota bacterium]
MGPQHPSTHGVLRVLLRTDGEIVTEAHPHIGYLHRCAEKIGECLDYVKFQPYTDRMDYLAAMNNNLGYAMVVESLAGLEIPERATLLRIIIVELNRIASHLIAFGTYGLDSGAMTPFFHAWREREEMLTLFEKICGARLTYNYVCIGGVVNDAPEGWKDKVLDFLDRFEKRWTEYNNLLSYNRIFIRRSANIGVITPEECYDYGLTGPMLRGSGISWDLRRDRPYLGYDRFDFDVPVGQGEMGTLGDCWDRYWVRMVEMKESAKIVRQAFDLLETAEGSHKAKVPKVFKPKVGEAYVGIENPRGELGFYVLSDGSKNAYRLRVRGPSFCNLSILEKLLPGTMIADAVMVIGSTDIVLGEVDR